jgi:hypothetical protein
MPPRQRRRYDRRCPEPLAIVTHSALVQNRECILSMVQMGVKAMVDPVLVAIRRRLAEGEAALRGKRLTSAMNVARVAALLFLCVTRFIWGNGERPWPVFATSALMVAVFAALEIARLVRARAGSPA